MCPPGQVEETVLLHFWLKTGISFHTSYVCSGGQFVCPCFFKQPAWPGEPALHREGWQVIVPSPFSASAGSLEGQAGRLTSLAVLPEVLPNTPLPE